MRFRSTVLVIYTEQDTVLKKLGAKMENWKRFGTLLNKIENLQHRYTKERSYHFLVIERLEDVEAFISSRDEAARDLLVPMHFFDLILSLCVNK
jgi:hypothetical protein